MENVNHPTTMNDLLKRDGVINNTPSENERPYKMRKLTAKDIGPMIRILKKVDLKKIKNLFTSDEIMELIEKAKENSDDVENENDEINENDKIKELLKAGGDVLIEIIPMILDALDNAIDDVNKLLANVINTEVEEVENMELDVYFMLVYDFLRKEEFTGFLKVASKSINMEK